jgi:hypothetical protein
MTLNNTATNVVAPTLSNLELRRMERKRELEAELWSGEVTPTTVWCRACRKDIALNSRNGAQYYRSNWDKHMEPGKCGNRSWLLAKHAQVIDSFVNSDPS